jgi:hypothetical protein
MTRRRILTLIIPLLLLTTTPLFSATLVLRGKSVIFGTYVGGGPEEIQIGKGEYAQTFRRADVVLISFGRATANANAEPLESSLDRLELVDGTVLDVWYAGGNESEIRVRVEGLMRVYPLEEVKRLYFGQPEAAPPAPPPPPSQPAKQASSGKSKPRRSGGNRWYFGGGLGASFGSVTYIQITPMLGYRVTNRLRAGLGLTWRYRKDDRYGQDLSTSDYGASLFSQYSVTRSLFIHGEYEYLSFEYALSSTDTGRDNYDSIFVGPGFSQPLGGRSAFSVLALYNLLYDDTEIPRPYDSAWVIRLGYSLAF